MSAHTRYNVGSFAFQYGHSGVCHERTLKQPPKIIRWDTTDASDRNLENTDWVALSGKRDPTKEKDLITVGELFEAFLSLMDIAYECIAHKEEPERVIARFMPTLMPKDGYMQHISIKFEPKHNSADILDLGHSIRMNDQPLCDISGNPYDVRFFKDRVFLISNQKALNLSQEHVHAISAFQYKHMGYSSQPNEIALCWEVRERMISYPCGLGAKYIGDGLIGRGYIQCLPYQLQQDVDIQIYLNIEALLHDMSLLDRSDNFSTYDGFKHIVKSGHLSGKHLLFTHFKCSQNQRHAIKYQKIRMNHRLHYVARSKLQLLIC